MTDELERKRERNREKSRRYYQKNKEKVRAKVLEKSREPEEQERRRQYQREYATRPEVIRRRGEYWEKYKNNGKSRQYTLRRTYNLSLEEWQEMYDAQGGICAIDGCIRKIKDTDHCHQTGMVRELLCRQCNHALGSVGDSIELLEGLIAYIVKHQSKGEG